MLANQEMGLWPKGKVFRAWHRGFTWNGGLRGWGVGIDGWDVMERVPLPHVWPGSSLVRALERSDNSRPLSRDSGIDDKRARPPTSRRWLCFGATVGAFSLAAAAVEPPHCFLK